jgi:O-antigen/teichoic acid export membrane protein
MFIQFVGSFFGKIILGRGLGDSAYGTFMVLLTTANLLMAVLHLGLPEAIAQKVPRASTPSEERSIITSAFKLSLLATIIIGGLFFYFAPRIVVELGVPEATLPLRILALGLPAIVFVRLSTGAIRATQRVMPHVVVKKIVQPLTLLGLYAFVVITGAGVVGATLAFIGATFTAAIVSTYYLLRDSPLFTRSIPTYRQYRPLVRFSTPLIFAAFAYTIFADIDTLLLSRLTTTAATGHYRAAYPLATLLTAPLSAFAFLLMPHLSTLDAENAVTEMQETYTQISSWIFFITFPGAILFILYPTEVIQLSFGSQYTPGAAALPILVVALGSHVFIGPNKDALTAIGETDFIMVVMVGTAIANIIFNLLLIPQWGIVGAAAATAGSYFLLNAMLSLRLYKRRRISPLSRRALGVGTGSALLAIACSYLVDRITGDSISALALFLVSFGGIYTVGVIRYGLSESDIEEIEQLAERQSMNLSILMKTLNYLRHPIRG